MTDANSSGARLPAIYLVAWYGITGLLMVALGSLRYPVAFWQLGREPRLVLGLMLCAHLASGAVILLLRYRRRELTLPEALTITTAVFGLALLLLFGLQVFGSRTVVIATFGGGLVVCGLPFFMRRSHVVYVLVLAMVAAASLELRSSSPRASIAPTGPREAVLPSNLYSVRALSFPDAVPRSSVNGGGLAAIGNQFLLTTGDGKLYVLNRQQRELEVRPVRGRVPINTESFRSTVSNDKVEVNLFRVTGLLVHEVSPTTIRVFASYHFWKEHEGCFVLRVSMVEGNPADLWQADELAWSTVFESLPCLPIKGQYRQFAGNASGGRMVLLDDNTLLVTVGDHEFDGVNAAEDYPQDASASYGKIVLIDLASPTRATRIFTMGHRNAQGLIVKSDGTIWATEHGPHGGDELNRIVPGRNYGWPLETYGTNYESRGWPLNKSQGRHDMFTPPVFAWVPSVGISSLLEVGGEKFSKWNGDLLVASLAGSTLFRVRVSGDRALFVEPIRYGARIRDLALSRDGSIALWGDGGEVVFLEPVEEQGIAGETMFWSACGGCHVVSTGSGHGIGPDLRAIATRGVAAAERFDYSKGLAALGGQWTAERLDAFLLDPEAVAPDTKMRNVSVKDPATRAAIVEYLRTLRE